MSADAARFEQRRDRLIERLEGLVSADPRIVALWLQGSLADGTADPLSDVDAYVAVEDAAFDEVFAERAVLAGRLGNVLAFADAVVPGFKALHCVLDGPVKLDLIFERRSQVPNAARPAVRVLVDKVGLGAQLKTGWAPSPAAVAQRVDAVYRMTRQGCTLPIRLLERGQWASFAMAELEVVNDNLAMLLAVQHDPRLLFKNRFSYPRLLPPDARASLETLTADAVCALTARDLPALRDVHLRIYDALVREGRAAYAALGMRYPGTEEGDAAIREFYLRDWPVEVPD